MSHTFLSKPEFALKPCPLEPKFCQLVRSPFSTSSDRWQANYLLQLKPIFSSGMTVSSSGPTLINGQVYLELCVKNKEEITSELCDQLAMSVLEVEIERGGVC